MTLLVSNITPSFYNIQLILWQASSTENGYRADLGGPPTNHCLTYTSTRHSPCSEQYELSSLFVRVDWLNCGALTCAALYKT